MAHGYLTTKQSCHRAPPDQSVFDSMEAESFPKGNVTRTSTLGIAHYCLSKIGVWQQFCTVSD